MNYSTFETEGLLKCFVSINQRQIIPIYYWPEPEFVNVEGAQESIPPAYVALQADTTTLFDVPVSQAA
jgi:hypothetical protein